MNSPHYSLNALSSPTTFLMNVLPEGRLHSSLKNPDLPNEFHLFHSSPTIGQLLFLAVIFVNYPG